MIFEEGKLYHIYNRSINRETVFFTDEDYLNFLARIRKYVFSSCDILAWCLMPNHFHFLIHTNGRSIIPKMIGGNTMPQISFGIKQLLSSYARSFNIKNNRTGNLFQQKTKSKLVSEDPLYALTVFHYIHQNPWRCGLVDKIENWQFSSYPDYIGLRKENLLNKDLAAAFLDLEKIDLQKETYERIPDSVLNKLDKWD